MRRQADSNRRTRFCRPLPNHSAMSPVHIKKKHQYARQDLNLKPTA
jgi:hypothetical protein